MLKSSCCNADVVRKDKSGQACLYCSKCGKWIKNANKDDLRALENNRASVEVGSKEPKVNTESGFIERGKMVNNLSSLKPVSIPVEKLVDAAIEMNADAILASTIISHDDIHYKNMKRIHELAVEKGIRDKVIIIAGGTQVTPENAVKQGVDAGFGRGSKGVHVATFLVNKKKEMLGLE